MTRRTAAISAALGAVLLIAPPALWQQTRPPAAVGEVPATAASEDGHDARTAAAPPADRDGRSGEDARAEVVDDEVSEPERLRIPELNVDAPLDPVGLADDGGMEIPDDVSRVGWYEPGVAPGEPGSAVLSGHVDSRTQGPGVLFDLRRAEVDDEIVIDAGGEEQRWKVVARVSYGKQALPVDELFVWEGEPQLVIITCGGEFDADAGAYEENIVVHAVPA